MKKRGALESFSFREGRGKVHLEDEAGRKFEGDNSPSIHDDVEQDGLEACLRAST